MSVYVIGEPASAEPVKVGWSEDPAARLAVLQTGNPRPLAVLATIEGGETEERALHAQLAHARVRGEWFDRFAVCELLARTRDQSTYLGCGLGANCPRVVLAS